MKSFEPQIEWRDPASLTPYSNNAKTHPTEQIDKIAASIASFGFDQPIVVDGDEVAEAPAEPVSELGDLWILGNHRLLCGDATVLADVERVLGGQLADMIWAKSTFTLGRAGYRRQYEPILYGWKDGANHYWCGARGAT